MTVAEKTISTEAKTEVKEVKLPEFDASVQEFIDAGAPSFLLNPIKEGDTTASLTVKKGLFYEHQEMRGNSKEVVDSVYNTEKDFIPATYFNFGKIAVEAFEKNKDLKEVTLNVPTSGKDSFDFRIQRSVTRPDFHDKEKMVTTYGQGEINRNTTLDSKRGGKTGAAFKHIKHMAKEALSQE